MAVTLQTILSRFARHWRQVSPPHYRKAAHMLRGAAANLTLSALSDTAQRIESCAVSGNLEQAGLLLPEIEQRIEEAVANLQKLLDLLQETPENAATEA